METGFDKEIDAILRRTRDDTPRPAAGPHVDADAVAAFVEGALPQAIRNAYIDHFSDCGPCRERLAGTVILADGAIRAPAATAAIAEVEPHRRRWYEGLFKTPVLATAMGLCVLLLAGLIALRMVEDRHNGDTVAMANRAETPIQEMPQSNASSNSASAANMPASSVEPSANTSSSRPQVAEPTLDSSSVSQKKPESLDEESPVAKSDDLAQANGSVSKSEAMPPPAPKPVSPTQAESAPALSNVVSRDDKKQVTAADAQPQRRAKMANDGAALPQLKAAPESKDDQSVETRSAGNAETHRVIAGRTFDLRNGVWYDRAYNGGSTKSVKRGTDKYRALDAGLRNIGDRLSGTVVVVWNSINYKIK